MNQEFNKNMIRSFKPQFRLCLDILLKMKYTCNSAVQNGSSSTDAKHEDNIKKIFLENGFSESLVNKGKKKVFTKEMQNNLQKSILNPGEFIEQPFGKNDNPDFVVQLTENSVISIEAKSSKDPKPQYNSGGIKNNTVYILSSSKYNQTTIYLGKSIILEKQQTLINELINKQKELEIEYNKKLNECDDNERGIAYYTRPMIIQKGSSEKTDYFKHKNRENCEKEVYTFIDELH